MRHAAALKAKGFRAEAMRAMSLRTVGADGGGETTTIPNYAVVNRDGSYILNRDGSYLVADPTPRTSA